MQKEQRATDRRCLAAPPLPGLAVPRATPPALPPTLAPVRAAQGAGYEFIGPQPHAMEVMGLKIPSMQIAQEAGVSTAPRYDGVIESVEHAVELA